MIADEAAYIFYDDTILIESRLEYIENSERLVKEWQKWQAPENRDSAFSSTRDPESINIKV